MTASEVEERLVVYIYLRRGNKDEDKLKYLATYVREVVGDSLEFMSEKHTGSVVEFRVVLCKDVEWGEVVRIRKELRRGAHMMRGEFVDSEGEKVTS